MTPPPNRAPFHLLVLIVMGACIGSGIFMTPSGVAAAIPYPGLLMLIWILGGIIALSGALSYGELAARFPQAGGVYAYLKEAYGPLPAFLFGWVVLLAVTSGAIAGLSLGFAHFLSIFIPMGDAAQKLTALAVITICTLVNVQGFGLGQRIAGLVTALKVIGILAIILAGITFQAPVPIDWGIPELRWDMLSPMLLGLVGVYWAYGGWHHLTYLAGEMPQQRDRLASAMLVGVIGVMAAYVLANVAYLRALPLGQLTQSQGVAADMMEAVFPGTGGKLLAALICISVFGSILIFTMSAPRIYAAMAADGVFFPALARVNPRTGTPVAAILLQSAWAVVLLFFWGTFGKLVDYVTYTEAIFLVMAAAAVYVFRQKDKRQGIPQPQGFKVPGYPFTPLIYIIISGAFVVNGMISKPELAIAAAVLITAGTLAFLAFKRSGPTQP